MTKLKLETAAKPQVSEGNSALAEAVGRSAALEKQVLPGLGSISDIREEINDVLLDMRVFHAAEPDAVMRAVSAHAARLVEIIVHVQRIEATRREWKPVREEANFVLTELRSQFQIASRILAMRAQDWEMSGRGQT